VRAKKGINMEGFKNSVKDRKGNGGRSVALGYALCAALFFCTAGAALAGAQDTPPPGRAKQPDSTKLTIQEAIDEAIEHNLGLLAERLNLSIADARIVTAKLRPNPVFSFSSDHLDLLGTSFNSTNGAGPTELAWRVDVPYERGHKRDLRVATAGADREIAQAQLMQSILDLRRDVALACIDIIQQRAFLELSRQNLATYENLVQINETRVNAGSIPPLELTRSRVAMMQFRATVKKAELAQLTARIKLQSLLGRAAFSPDFDIAGEIGLRPSATTLTLAALQVTAFQKRPDVQAMQLTQARSQADLKLQLAQGKIDLTWGAEVRRQQGVNGTGNSAGVFLSLPVPIYNRNQGEIERAQVAEEQASRQIAALRAQVQAEVATSLQEFESTRDLVTTIERDLLQPARQARDTSDYVYRSGGSSLIEFLDAQRAFNDTMQSYLEAQGDYRRATIRLNAAVNEELVQ
jgi:cobalt-zinc-cadmium efflux system outer membrane protein